MNIVLLTSGRRRLSDLAGFQDTGHDLVCVREKVISDENKTHDHTDSSRHGLGVLCTSKTRGMNLVEMTGQFRAGLGL